MGKFKKKFILGMVSLFNLVGCGISNKQMINKTHLNEMKSDDVKIDETLPLGTIVTLKEWDQNFMIINRGVLADTEDGHLLFEYSACLYPNGADINTIYYFNKEDIDKVIFEGYENDDEKIFETLLKEWNKEKAEIHGKGVIKY